MTKTCLVLAGNHILMQIESAIDSALKSIGVERISIPPEELIDLYDSISICLAEVTKPSPTISYQIGVLDALEVPMVLCAGNNKPVSPVFENVHRYSPADEELAGFFESILPLAIETPTFTDIDPRPAPKTNQDGQFWENEIVQGFVVFARPDKGYALVEIDDRPIALLHVSRMTPGTRQLLEVGELQIGHRIDARVVKIDGDGVMLQERLMR